MTTARPASLDPHLRAPSSVREEVEEFLYREARLLDTDRQREWLDCLVDPEIVYRVSSSELRMRRDKRDPQSAATFLYDDRLASLQMRVGQFETGLQWRTDPPERLRHLVTNIEAFIGERDNEFIVLSNCLVSRNRRVYDEATFIYGREDVLRRDSKGQLRLQRRHIDLDQRCVEGRSLLFFL